MLDFITRFFRREEASKNLAKERLRLVLMSDRVSLAPETFDSMKGEMLTVIRRYLDIDEPSMDLHFENADRQFVLLANIPVLKVKPLAEIGPLAIAPNGSAAAATNGSPGAAVRRPRRRRRRRSAAPPPVAEPAGNAAVGDAAVGDAARNDVARDDVAKGDVATRDVATDL